MTSLKLLPVDNKHGEGAANCVPQGTACSYSFFWAKGLKPTEIFDGTDLAPSDYHLFGPMKKMLGGLRFTSDLEAQTVVREWLAQQPASFFAEGIQKLVPRWDKCLNVRGGYVEK